jgi:anaerobic selenocysteine-containing dehydrogenase
MATAAARVVKGACPLDCPDACAWVVEVDAAGRAIALRGNRDHPFTAGALCGKVNRYLDALYDPGRLLHPLRRIGPKGEGRFERITWDEALALVAGEIRQAIDRYGPESVLPFYFAGTMGRIQGWSLGPRLFRALGASRLETTICDAAANEALELTLGGAVGLDPEDIRHAKLVVLWGTNVLSTNVHQWKFVLEAREQGAHLVAIDPLRTDTASRCDEHVAPLPGTDAALALGLMRAVLDTGAEDRDWLERHTLGWPELEERLGEWPLERTAEVCGLDVGVVRDLGQRLARTRPTAIRVGLGLQRHGGAGAAIRAILSLPAVTGDWRRVGGGALSETTGHFPHDVAPVVAPPDLPAARSRSVNMSRLGHALTELDDPPVATLVVFDANPAASNPDQNRVRAGLARDDLFTVVLEQRLTDTTDFADVVLPVTMQPEHHDLIDSYGHNYLAWNEPAIDPPGECLTNNEVFRRIARSLGLDHPRLYDGDLELGRQLLDTNACRERGITLEALRERGWLRAADFSVGVAPYADGGFPTPSGKVELRSERLAEQGLDPLVGYVPSHEVADAALAERYPLALLSPAARFFVNSTFASIPWHQGKVGPIRVHLHPVDAAARGIEEGARVHVRNDRGSFEGQAILSEAARPGVAFTYKSHWPKLVKAGMNPNATTPERDADLGGSPTFQDNRVEVELVGPSTTEAQALPLTRPVETFAQPI